MRETPFALTYRNEALIPIEFGMLSPWVQQYNEKPDSRVLKENLDLFLRRKAGKNKA